MKSVKKKEASKVIYETENVAIGKERLEKIKEHKSKTGCSIKFFIEQAIDNEFKRLENVVN